MPTPPLAVGGEGSRKPPGNSCRTPPGRDGAFHGRPAGSREGQRRRGASSQFRILTARSISNLRECRFRNLSDFPGCRSFVALAVGSVKLNSLDDWTSNTYSFPPVGPLADVNEQNLSLRLIDQPVVGRGAASGLLQGTIKALFYRYRSVGGSDYVGDFLISPKGNQTEPGPRLPRMTGRRIRRTASSALAAACLRGCRGFRSIECFQPLGHAK
jgi:hypothetical protein